MARRRTRKTTPHPQDKPVSSRRSSNGTGGNGHVSWLDAVGRYEPPVPVDPSPVCRSGMGPPRAVACP